MAQLRLQPTRGGIEHDLVGLLDRTDEAAEAELAEFFGIPPEEDEGYRISAPSTQKRQDTHLKRWVYAMRAKLKTANPNGPWKTMTDREIIDQEMKNATQNMVINNMRWYLRAEIKWMKPRSGFNTRPRYKSLTQCRDSMLFWIPREMGEERAPTRKKLVDSATETLVKWARAYGVNRERHVKTYFGRYELKQLIEWSTLRASLIDLYESHHIAWCLGLVCGVRPGSIGWTKHHKDQYLCFKEIEITRGPKRGQFSAKLDFLYLKGNRDDLGVKNPLTFQVNGAIMTQNLTVSIPHRILIIALRREGLLDHDSVESLLNGDERIIRFKPDFRNKPLCRQGGPRGMSIKEDALGYSSMTEFLKKQATDAGYPREITMYSWRRKAATVWVRTFGTDVARQMMDHEQGSATLQDHYDQGLYDKPVFEAAMGQDTGMATAVLDENSPEVLRRLVHVRRLEGAFLQRRVNEILGENEEYRKAAGNNDMRAMKLLERRARKLAHKAYHDEQVKTAQRMQTNADFRQRMENLNDPGELTKRIRNEVKNRMTRDASEDDDNVEGSQQNPVDIDDGSQAYDVRQDRDLEYEDLIDAEDDFNRAEQRQQRVDVDTDPNNASWDEGQEETYEEFAVAVEVFMKQLLEMRPRFDSPVLYCDLCRTNEYRTDDERNKVWSNISQLNVHKRGSNHSMKGEVRAKLEHNQRQAADGKFHCPYGDCKGQYKNLKDLMEHIATSGPPLAAEDLTEAETRAKQKHDDDKRADQWYHPDFDKYKAHTWDPTKHRTAAINYSAEREVDNPTEVTVKDSYKAVIGGDLPEFITKIPEHYKTMIRSGADEGHPHRPDPSWGAPGDTDLPGYLAQHPMTVVPQHLRAAIATGMDQKAVHPQKFKELVERAEEETEG